ncbi:MAG: transcription elongation factor GreA [Sphingobacteriia bacterium]|jgi:transcription elongation factor GreA|nr:transcription elongation factor GreA [Paludibacteraceae bacterium]NCA79187.1 transcription elongation factor GreA [Sphingobacteriia bacterium]
MAVSYMSEAGYKQLNEQLRELESQRPVISRQIAEARDKGDLSENAEYDAAREAQGMLELKISQLKETIATARIIDESKLSVDTVKILNKVRIKNLANNQEVEYMLVSESESNIRAGKLAVTTPIGKGLLGKKVGDVIAVQVPSGTLSFEVLNISI